MPNPPPQGAQTISRRGFCLAAVAVIFIVTAAIRIYGAHNDLWLDEIWSIKIAGRVSSPLDVFTKLHHEINHYFNTLWLWMVANHGNWLSYRLPSLVTGCGTVVLAGMIGRRRNLTSAFMAMLVVGFSYIMVLYSSEARGYAMTVFFSFLSYYALDRFLEKPRWQFAVLFSVSSLLGLVAQPIFASFMFAALVWSAYRLSKPFRGWKAIVAGLWPCHAVPFAFLAILYCVDLHQVVAGGGTPSPLIYSYRTALAWGLGAPAADAGKFLMCVPAVVVFLAGLLILWRERSDAPVFFLGIILVFPVSLLLIRGSDAIYTRHFIIGIAFLLILFSYVLAALYDRAGASRLAALAILTIYFLINGQLLATLFKYGRGHYSDAIRFMADHTKFPVVTIGSDHDFQTTMVLEFYQQRALGGKKVKYIQRDFWSPSGPEWFVAHKESFDSPAPPALELNDDTGRRYEWVKTYPAAPLSGLHWFIYHNVSDGALDAR